MRGRCLLARVAKRGIIMGKNVHQVAAVINRYLDDVSNRSKNTGWLNKDNHIKREPQDEDEYENLQEPMEIISLKFKKRGLCSCNGRDPREHQIKSSSNQ